MKEKRTDTGRRGQIIAVLKEAGEAGHTTDEIQKITGIVRSSITARLTELQDEGFVKESGARRKASSGRFVTVYVLTNDKEIPDVLEAEEKELPKVPSHPQTFWKGIRSQVLAFVQDTYKEADESSRVRYLHDLESDLKAAAEHFTRRMYKSKVPPVALISRRKLLDACDVLRVPPPPIGKPVDLAIAKKNKRHASRLYHPDVSGQDNKTTRALFEAAIEAYAVLEQYNQLQES